MLAYEEQDVGEAEQESDRELGGSRWEYTKNVRRVRGTELKVTRKRKRQTERIN
jgi:hypothetical protein